MEMIRASTDHDIIPVVCEFVSLKYFAIISIHAKTNTNKKKRNDIDTRKETSTFS